VTIPDSPAASRPLAGALTGEGRDLALTRTVPAPARRIWEHVSRSDLLATWYGTYTGNPATGSVEVTMTAEPGEASTSEYTIHACEPERRVTVSSSMGEDSWRLSLELGAAADGPGSTQVVLRHHDVSREMLQHVGPGWEWYLDRLIGAVTGGDIPGMDVWDSHYMVLSEAYGALAG